MKRQSCHHTETSQLICIVNQLTGFYMITTLASNELISAASEKMLSLALNYIMLLTMKATTLGCVAYIQNFHKRL